MISQQTTNRSVTSTLTGESNAFSLDVNGKAFRILMDGIYTNKIATPMREYATNAYDSHVAAGCPDKPIKITLPTTLNKVYSVRDFGVSLAHVDVMELYSTMFRSTKSDSNDEVGAFGLGSKSAFAYTDTFNVITFLDGERRVYVAVIGDDDIPRITHVHTEPTDEPNGLEVTIPVRDSDIHSFVAEAKMLAMGFDVIPEFNIPVTVPKPDIVGDGYRIYNSGWSNNGYGYSRAQYAIRQGCVVYPVDSMYVPNSPLGSYTSIIVDVPIGTCEVATSREALSMDDRTKQNVRDYFQAAFDTIKQHYFDYVAGATGLVDAMRRRDAAEEACYGVYDQCKWNDKPIPRHITFKDMTFSRIGSRGSLEASRKGESGFALSEFNSNWFVIDRGQKIIRRKTRLNDYKSLRNHNVWVIHHPTNKQLERLVRLMELDRSRIVSLDALPDNFTPKPREHREKPTGVYNAYRVKVKPEDIPDEIDLWLPIDRGNSVSMLFHGFGHNDPRRLGAIYQLAEIAGMSETPYLLTAAARKAYKVDDTTRYDLIVWELIQTLADKAADVRFNQVVKNGVPYDARRAGIYEVLPNLLRTTDARIQNLEQTGGYLWKNLLTKGEFRSKIEVAEKEAKDKLAELSQAFPLLFTSDITAVRDYMESRKDKVT